MAVAGLLTVHWALAVLSLLGENPTVDEVVHLPAGLSYWQTGTFRLYPHNPPLIKLIAAWPVAAARPVSGPLYQSGFWATANKTGFAHLFADLTAPDYLELFTKARLLMPWFSVLGGLVVFAWSRRLYGAPGGLLSLTLWAFCPNILAHARLVTTDVGASVLGFSATFLFWRYLKRPTWPNVVAAGLALGLAELSKFSMILLYGLWPLLWLIHEFANQGASGRPRRLARAVGHGFAIVFLSVLTINPGYGFEGVGRPLGTFPFASGALTRWRDQPVAPSPAPDDLLDRIRQFRVNRFRDTILENLPVPLPRYYVSGFDEQKLEAEGVPRRVVDPTAGPDDLIGYPVYLDGVLRDRSWRSYYLLCLVYKVPEGTWLLVLWSFLVLGFSTRGRAAKADEATVLMVPLVVLGVMSLLTNINLGLRYVLPIFPYIYVSVGKLAPWAAGLVGRRKGWAFAAISAALLASLAASASIHPHYLTYFNVVSGGPDHGSAHLIDSNLDWGQDLVGLERWVQDHSPTEPIGIAYFGQINPDLFARRGRPLNWFLPPPLPGTMDRLPPVWNGVDPSRPPPPGLYAVSASLVRGLDWRVYAPGQPGYLPAHRSAFRYFQELTPFAKIGYSIFLYRVSETDVRRLARHW